jgi:hypothetical protein
VQNHIVRRTSRMLGQADERDDVTCRRPSLIVGVFTVQRENCVYHVHGLSAKTNLHPGFSNSCTQHRATASKMAFLQADIRLRHVIITDDNDLSEETLNW